MHCVPEDDAVSHQPSPALMNARMGLDGTGGRARSVQVSPRFSETKRWSKFTNIQTTPPPAAAMVAPVGRDIGVADGRSVTGGVALGSPDALARGGAVVAAGLELGLGVTAAGVQAEAMTRMAMRRRVTSPLST